MLTDFRRDCSPEGSVCLGCQQRGGGWLELLGAHAHGLLHLGGGGRDEVLVNVAAQALLPQHPAHQLQGGAEGLLPSGYLGPETVRTWWLINEYFYENESVRSLCDECYPIFFIYFILSEVVEWVRLQIARIWIKYTRLHGVVSVVQWDLSHCGIDPWQYPVHHHLVRMWGLISQMGIVHCMSLMVAIVGWSGMSYPDRLYENDKTGKRC